MSLRLVLHYDNSNLAFRGVDAAKLGLELIKAKGIGRRTIIFKTSNNNIVEEYTINVDKILYWKTEDTDVSKRTT